MIRRTLPAILILLLLSVDLSAEKREKNVESIAKPKLVVLIVVDQMRADHLTRFAGVYKHGFARLLNEGAVFTDAYHDHAYTVTAAGHATISTGAFPSRNGIVGNEWFDRSENKKVYCAEDTSAALLGYPEKGAVWGRSPRRLLVPTFGDRLKSQSPKSKVFGVSRKDRAAIYGTGSKADGAFWYNIDDGNFITSEYYYKKYPEWVEAFNTSRSVDAFYGKNWQKLMPEEVYFLAREDTFATEGGGAQTVFPHSLASESGKPDKMYYSRLTGTPFLEKLVLDFARALVENEQLGQDEAPDVLVIGCSGADAVGHTYGPLSQESMDYFLRLDRNLGDFFAFLDKKISKENYITVLSSDHGVLPMPEELARRGFDARRISGQEMFGALSAAITNVSEELQIKGKLITGFHGKGLFVNYKIAEEKGISPADLDKMLVEKLRQIDFIEDVFTKDELTSANGDGRPYQNYFKHSYHPQRSGDLTIRLRKYYLIHGQRGTSHGSTYKYDRHVPIVFSGAGIRSGQFAAKVRTVDIAPTLANILGMATEGEIDGRSFLEIIRRK